MNALDYLDSLIAGCKMDSSIPVQLTELQFLKTLIQKEKVHASNTLNPIDFPRSNVKPLQKKHDGPCWRNSHADCGC